MVPIGQKQEATSCINYLLDTFLTVWATFSLITIDKYHLPPSPTMPQWETKLLRYCFSTKTQGMMTQQRVDVARYTTRFSDWFGLHDCGLAQHLRNKTIFLIIFLTREVTEPKMQFLARSIKQTFCLIKYNSLFGLYTQKWKSSQ